MDYMNILQRCVYLREKAISEDPNFNADNYHWELGHYIVEELLRGLNAIHLESMNELYGIRVEVTTNTSLLDSVRLFKEVK